MSKVAANETRNARTMVVYILHHHTSRLTFTRNKTNVSATTIRRVNATKVKVAISHTVVYPTLGQGVLDSLLAEKEVAAGVAAEKDVAVVVVASKVEHLVTHL